MSTGACGTQWRAEEPFHPLGQPRAGAEDDGVDLAFFASTPPPYEQVLAVRSERLAQVREFLASVDDAAAQGR